jgi:valyl-tRNA synthetase
VLLHGLVVDETGEKMSKVKGNVIDPLDLIHGATFESVVDKALPGAPPEEALKKFKKAYPSAASMGTGFSAYGADALRFALATYSPQAKRIPLSPKKIEGYRHFCNKIWNATRFALPYIEGARVTNEPPVTTSLTNRWLLSRLGAALAEAEEGIATFRFDESSSALYRFFWGELCDWFLELAKPVFSEGTDAEKAETRDVLAYALEASMRALHPFMPFITEELWQKLPRPEGSAVSVVLAPYPKPAAGPRDEAAERDMSALQAIISAARTVRSEHEVHPGAEVQIVLRSNDPARVALLQRELRSVRVLAKTAGLATIEPSGGPRPRGSVMSIAQGTEVLVGLRGLVEPNKEADRVERELRKVEKDIAATEKKLALPSFTDKAPPEVVAEAHTSLAALRDKRVQLEEARGLAAELA